MASYLRPRRGQKSTAEAQAIVLKKGEVFFEIGNGGTPTTGSSAKAFGKIKMGDGTTTYSNLGYFLDVDTTAVDWDNSGYATATEQAQGAELYGNLNAVTPTATLKSILGNVKALLYKLATQVTTLNNDLTTSNNTVFNFTYDTTSSKYGYLNSSGTFVSFGGDSDSPIKSVTYVAHTMVASNWDSGNEYSFENTYPASRYDIFVGPSNTMTAEEFVVASNALMTGNKTANKILALGEKPTVSFPVILRVEDKIGES